VRVAIYYKNTDIRIQHQPVPKIGTGELLMRVMASGICGSDVMEWYRQDKIPLVLGHEVAGEVVQVGEGIDKYKIGDRISASHHVPCRECHYCVHGHETVCDTLRKTSFDPGGFAEYLRLSSLHLEEGVYILPESVSFEEATFIEPLACVLRGQRLAGIKSNSSVFVIGSGISGLLHIQMAKINQASRLIASDINEFRLKKAKLLGADEVIQASRYTPLRLRQLNSGRLADLVILCASAESALVQALDSLERGGTLLIFAAMDKGVKFKKSVNDIFWRNEVTIISSYASSPSDHLEALELIRLRKINVRDMITHRLKLSEIQKGFELVSRADNSLKVIIKPQQ
jgi:L-iditol 2-dehydrogenase